MFRAGESALGLASLVGKLQDLREALLGFKV